MKKTKKIKNRKSQNRKNWKYGIEENLRNEKQKIKKLENRKNS